MKKMFLFLFLFIGLIGAAVIAKAQDSLAKKPADSTAKKDVAKEKPIADSIAYISNNDLKGIYRYISDRTTGTQYFELFIALDGAIKEAQRKAADRYRRKKKDK